jgi:hypothetical protein
MSFWFQTDISGKFLPTTQRSLGFHVAGITESQSDYELLERDFAQRNQRKVKMLCPSIVTYYAMKAFLFYASVHYKEVSFKPRPLHPMGEQPFILVRQEGRPGRCGEEKTLRCR